VTWWLCAVASAINYGTEAKGDWAHEVLRNIDFHRFIWEAHDGNNLAHPVRAVIEEEQGIIVFTMISVKMLDDYIS
jgi:hypothetical protein